MLGDSDVALALLSEAAYSDPPVGIPAGFTPVTLAALGITLTSQETFAGGLYTAENAAALVTVGTLNGVTTLVIAFRGSDNRQDSINDLQNINAEYSLFGRLIPAVDALIAKEGIPQVEVTGHSLGGAMAQLYMASHADNANVDFISDTFGSPGALQSPAADPRITNIQVADDPAVYLGLNRASVGAQLQTDPVLATAAIFAGPEVFPGLTSIDVLNSIPDLNTNYVNRGSTVLLPDANGSYATDNSLLDAVNAGKSEHVIDTYVSRLETLTGDDGQDQVGAGITPTTVGVQIYRFFEQTDGTHFYTDSTAERDQVIATRPDLVYEGVGLNGVTPAMDSTAAPIYRFFDSINGTHFYTASATEVASVEMTRPDMTYEGVGFYEDTSPKAGDTAVYRFFDQDNGTHFYTANQNELASVDATRPDLTYEGIAFYTLSA